MNPENTLRCNRGGGGLAVRLVVSILVAYLVKVGRRDRLPIVGGGAALAIGVSIGFGALLTYTSTTLLADFKSQEIFGGTMSAIAVVFVTWMVFWMRAHRSGMRSELDGRLSSALTVGAFAVGLTDRHRRSARVRLVGSAPSPLRTAPSSGRPRSWRSCPVAVDPG